MPRLSLKDVLTGLAIASFGLGMIAFAVRWRIPVFSKCEPFQISLAVAGSITMGQGISYPFGKGRRWVGLLIGMAILFAVVLVIMQLKTF